MTSLLLALDFGGTKLAASTLDLDQHEPRQWHRLARSLSPKSANAQTDLAGMRSLIAQVLDGETPAAIGVSFGGPVDATTGTVRLSHHVPGWENIPLAKILSDEFGVPASVDNDANVAALGEARFGAGQGQSSLLYVTVSTGVGGGWILDGKPWRGRGGMAGEIGHTVVDPQGPLCLCGKRGCVERLASGPYMAEDVRSHLQQHPNQPTLLWQLVQNNLENLTAQHISEAANQGDEYAWNRLEKAAWALGVGIGNAANLIDPGRVILGGGVTKSGDRFWQTLRQVAQETILPEINLEIVPAQLGDEAPLWGAIALATDFLSPP